MDFSCHKNTVLSFPQNDRTENVTARSNFMTVGRKERTQDQRDRVTGKMKENERMERGGEEIRQAQSNQFGQYERSISAQVGFITERCAELQCRNFVAAVAEWYGYRIIACLVTSSSPVPLKTRRVGQRCTLNLSRAETSSRWCGVVVRREGCQLRCRPRHLTMVQNYVVRRQKPSCS
ncbi:uncharacterized protein TNCV_1128481 [Trichonephila clavipes]|nr:uncharacterized protein TNCV_1128481 [Trichonephila clavipes]